MSNPDVTGSSAPDPAGGAYGGAAYPDSSDGRRAPAGADYGNADYGSRGNGGGAYRGAGQRGGDGNSPYGDALNGNGNGRPSSADDSYRGRSASRDRGGRDGYQPAGDGAGPDGWAAPAASSRDADDPWDTRSSRRGSSRRRPGPDPAADPGRGDPRYSGQRPAGPPGERAPADPRGGRGYRPDQAAGDRQAAQDLRDRLGVRGTRDGRGAAAPNGAGPNGARPNGVGPNGAGPNSSYRDGAGPNGGRQTGGGLSGGGQTGSELRSSRQDPSQPGTGQRVEDDQQSRRDPRPAAHGQRRGAGYAEDSYGRTQQGRRPGMPGEDGRDELRNSGPNRRSAGGRGGRGGGGYGDGPDGPGGSGSGRGGFKQWLLYGSWWRHWTWKKAAAVCGGAAVLVILLVGGTFAILYGTTTIPTATTVDATSAPSQVYYSNGKLMGAFTDGGPTRVVLTESQIPQVMKNAMIAAEDRHFYTEGGISITGIARAAWADVEGGGYDQGGSTLTEQLVKNYYSGFEVDNSDKAAGDKLKEIMVSIKLAHTKSKSWILTQYLNVVPFGQNAEGVGAAAETYFNEPVSKLTTGQAAMLAAMPNAPGYFNPDPSAGAAYQALKARWLYVLGGMVKDGALSQAKATKIEQHFPKVHYHFASSLSGYRGYLMQMVEQELTTTYGMSQREINSGGLKITTTFSQSLINGLYKSVAENKTLMREGGRALPSYAHVGAVLEQPSSGAILAVYGGPGYGVKDCAKVYCYLNMAEDPKQVGSSFKPYVLATAVSQGMNVQTSILDGYSPIWIPEGASLTDRLVLSSRSKPTAADYAVQSYLPFNEADEDSGALTVAKAAAISSDPAFEDLAHRVGVQNVINMARSMGVGQTPFNQGGANDFEALNAQFGDSSKLSTGGSVAIALGEGDLTAVEQASMIATLANGGTYHSPHVISKIIRVSNEIPLKIQTNQVLTAAQAADADYALSFDNVPGGTAYPDAAWAGRQVIGKTGTTQTAQDAWFLGAVPQDAMSVALFTNKQDSESSAGSQTLDILPDLPNNATGGYGGAWPAKIWDTYMLSEFGESVPAALPTPNYINFSKWNLVGAVAQKPRPQPTTTSPSPGGGSCPPGGPVGQCQSTSPAPTTSISPTPPTSPSTSPSPTCTPSWSQQCHSSPPAANAANAADAADETTLASPHKASPASLLTALASLLLF